MKNLTGTDLKEYRESLKLTQRAFARAYGLNRNTLAAYEWQNKKLPLWIVAGIVIVDPFFVEKCKELRDEKKPVKRPWYIRLYWKIMGA